MFSRAPGYWSNPAMDARGLLTSASSQRENWYVHSQYVAEMGCFLTNAGFVFVAYRWSSWCILLAGLLSALSHAIPWKVLHKLDICGVLIAVGGVAVQHWQAIAADPLPVARICLELAAINAADYVVVRVWHRSEAHWLWHIAAAYGAHVVLGKLGCID